MFVLEWNTIKAAKVKLYKAGQSVDTVQEGTRGFKNGTRYPYSEQKPSSTSVYKLEALDATDPNKLQKQEDHGPGIPARVAQGG